MKRVLFFLLIITISLFGNTLREQHYNNDAAFDRTIVHPTADTLEQFDFTLNSYNVIIAGASFGVTDWFQLSATILFGDAVNHSNSYFLTGKIKIIETYHSSFSLLLGGGYTKNINHPKSLQETAGYLQGGFIYSYLNDYKMQLSIGAHILHHAIQKEDFIVTSFISAMVPLGVHWKMLWEYTYIFAQNAPQYQPTEYGQQNQLFAFGVRRGDDHFSWDCSILIQKDQGAGPFCSINIRP